MRGLLRGLAVIMVTGALMATGIATASPDDPTPTPPQPPTPVTMFEDGFLAYGALGGAYHPASAVTNPADTQWVAPMLRQGAYVALDVPRSLVVYRGADVVVSVPRIAMSEAMPGTDAWRLDPNGLDPAWISNRGSMIGTAMSAAIIAGHNVYGGTTSPFYNLGDIRPGDMIDVTLRSGAVVRFQVHPGDVTAPLKETRWQELSPRALYLMSCTPDGQRTVIVKATAVSL